MSIQSLQQEKDTIEEELQFLLKSSPDIRRIAELRKRKTYLTRQMSMIRFRLYIKRKKNGTSEIVQTNK